MISCRLGVMSAVLAVVLLAACEGLVPEKPRELMALEDFPPPRFSVLAGRRIETVLHFIGPCCDPEAEFAHEVDGPVARVWPYVRFTPCPYRCATLHTDSTVLQFEASGTVHIRVMGPGPDGEPIIQLDTAFVIP